MPQKGRRVAAKQAKLGQKRRKRKGPSGIPAQPPASGVVQPTTPTAATPAPASASPMTPATPARRAPAYAPAMSAARRVEPRNRPLAYAYVGPEMRRIAIISSVIIAVIVTLSFVLN